MATLLFDIDGTLTNQWPLERCVLAAMTATTVDFDYLRVVCNGDLCKIYKKLTGQQVTRFQFRAQYIQMFRRLRDTQCLPQSQAYKAAQFIRSYRNAYRFVYVTGGTTIESGYILQCLSLLDIFDLECSLSRDNYRFTKASGLPFKKLRRDFAGPILLITDSITDIIGAQKAGIPGLQLRRNQAVTKSQIEQLANLV